MDSSLLMNAVMLTDDGNTLLAVRQGQDGSLELMSTPVAIIQDPTCNTLRSLKSSSCNVTFNQDILLNSTQQQLSQPIDRTDVESQNYSVPRLEFQQRKLINNSLQKKLIQDEKKNESSKIILDSPLNSNKDATLITSLPDTLEEVENVESSLAKKKENGKSKKKSKSNNQPACLKCDICGQEFKKQYLMQKHMHDHAQEKPYHCPKCPASFNVPSNFTLHMATHRFSDPKCPECGKKFARVASLKTHMVIHEVDENLYCTECDDKFETKLQLEAHLKLHNEKCLSDEHRKCKLCRKQFSQPAIYRQHLREHYKLQTKFSKQTKWGVRHRTTYKCKICMKMFDKPSQLVRHIRVHTGEKPYKCHLCNRGFTQKGSVRIHMWQHNGFRPFSCNFCSATFSQKGNLNSHVDRVHKAPQEGSTMYRCTQCPCIFKKLGSLNGHVKRVHGGAGDDAVENRQQSQQLTNDCTVLSTMNEQISSWSTAAAAAAAAAAASSSALSEPESEKSTRNDTAAENRQKFEDGFVVVTDDTAAAAEKTALVTLFDTMSTTSKGKHLKIKQRFLNNSRFYECPVCDKKFKKPSDLIRHLRIHTQEKPFKCKICNRSFTLKSTMLTHEKIHKNAKRFACGLCFATFKFQNELSDHEKFHKEQQVKTGTEVANKAKKLENAGRTIRRKRQDRKKQSTRENLMPEVLLKEPLVLTEAGDGMLHAQPKYRNDLAYGKGRPHKCYACPAAFMKLSHLKQHHRKHTGERPFACHLCDRTFSTNSSLKAHRRTHDFLRPHECSICGKTFSTLSSMKRHHITHTNKRPYMCPYCNKTFKSTVNCRKHMKLHKQEIVQQQRTTTVNETEMITIAAEPTIINNEHKTFESVTANLQHTSGPRQLQRAALGGNDKETSFLSSIIPRVSPPDLPDPIGAEHPSGPVNTTELHANKDCTDAADLAAANYSGNPTFTSENIRHLEETLNQQFINIEFNAVAANSTRDSKSIDNLENREAPCTLNIIYNDGKMLIESSKMGSSTINANNVDRQFENQQFDISQLITLQADLTETLEMANTTDLTNVQLSQTHGYTVRLVESNAEIISILSQNGVKNPLNHKSDNINENKTSIAYNCHTAARKLGNFADVNSSLGEHLKRHENGAFECTQCPAKFVTNEKLGKHVKVHDIQETHKCYECHKEFSTTLQLREHIKEHVKYELKLKNLGVGNNANDFECEIKKNEATNKKINICQYCSKSFRKPSDLIRHVRTHTGEKPYQCQHCDKSFAVKCTLDSHLKVHAGEKTYYCNVCNTRYATRGSLKVHMRLHTGDRPFACTVCNMTFRTSGHRKVHMISHTRGPAAGCCSRKSKKDKTPEVGAEAMEQPSDEIVQMAAAVSCMSSESQQLLRTSSQNRTINGITMNQVTDTRVTLTSDNSCTPQSDACSSTNLLALSAENNQLVQLLLANGLVTAIQTDDSVICTAEPSASSSAATAEQAQNNTFIEEPHELQKETDPLQITESVNAISQPTTNASGDYQLLINDCMVLQIEENVVDEPAGRAENSDDFDTFTEAKCLKNLKHKCQECGKRFAKPCQVERHRRTHTGERPFQCETCNKSFSQKSTLQMHQKHHRGDRPHACPRCQRSFTQSGNLLTHLRRVHKLDPAETKRLPKEQQFVFYDPKLLLLQNAAVDDSPRNICLDDIPLVELLLK